MEGEIGVTRSMIHELHSWDIQGIINDIHSLDIQRDQKEGESGVTRSIIDDL